MTTETAKPRSGSRVARVIILVLVLFILGTYMLWTSGMLTPQARIALVTAAPNGMYWDMIVQGAQDAAKRYNINLTVIRPKPDEPSQSAALQSLIGHGLDGVAVSPNDPQRQAAVLSDIANDTSGNLITFDSDSPVSRRLCFLGTDNYDSGRTCADYIRQAIPNGGDVILCIGSLDKENGQLRRQGVIDELLDRSFVRGRPMDPVDAPLKGAKYTIVTTLVDGINPDKATTMAVDAIKKYPNTKCFVGLFAYSTPAILKALDQTGQTGKIQVVGFDANDQTLAGVESGAVYATVVQDAYGIGFQTIRTLADVTRGDKRFATPMFPTFYLSADPVTKSNVAMVKAEMTKRMSGHGLDIPTPTAVPAASTQPAATTQPAGAT